MFRLFVFAMLAFVASVMPLTVSAQSPARTDLRTVPSVVETSDITRFWAAYDTIVATRDFGAQVQLIKRLYITPGSAGLADMMSARGYTAEQYVQAINAYPRYWRSIRANTLRLQTIGHSIDSGVALLRGAYPELVPAPVYFVIGVFRSGGTILNGRVLIGAEMALADSSIDTSEFPPTLSSLSAAFARNPIANIVRLTIHEYVHTQQRDHEYVLLYRAMYEGIAEFVSTEVTGTASSLPAISVGRSNAARVRARFVEGLLSPDAIDAWFYNSADNEFGVQDLGYYVGYEIAEGYYRRARDKRAAVREMLELDYTDRNAIVRYADASGYFATSLREELARYESKLPYVLEVAEITNGDTTVNASLKRFTIRFSTAMDRGYRNFNRGPLGEPAALPIRFLGFAEDGLSATVEVSLLPGRRYQLVLGNGFRSPSGLRMRPYLIDFRTAR